MESLKLQMAVNEELRAQQKQTMEMMQEELARQAKENRKLTKKLKRAKDQALFQYMQPSQNHTPNISYKPPGSTAYPS